MIDVQACVISIIIPTLDEENYLPGTLEGLKGRPRLQVLVVDGGSVDRTREMARAGGSRVIATRPGRAVQMNAGANEAEGGILLFLHADTRLPADFDELIRSALGQPEVSGGAFTLHIDNPRAPLRLVERFVAWRSRWLNMPYGDQALFMTATMFADLGGFPDIPIMEDYEMARRLRRRGRLVILPAAVRTSARRWLKRGIWRTTLRNQAIIVGYKLGIPPSVLARWRG